MGFLEKVVSAIGWFFVLLTTVAMLGIVVVIAALVTGRAFGEESLTVSSDHAVGIVNLSGEIFSADEFQKTLSLFVKEKKIKAIVLRIDSPGGAVGASEEIYRSLLAAGEKKPIVCALGNVAASGGLYAAMGCKKIIAASGTITGSIGVIAMFPEATQVLDKFGVRMNVIKSGKFKDTGSPFRSFSEDDQRLVQDLIGRSYEQFVGVIADSRKLERDEVRKFADGRIFLGEDALKLGLVDQLGGIELAAKEALKLAGDDHEPDFVHQPDEPKLVSLVDSAAQSLFPTWLRPPGLHLLYQ
jgi:protease IV